MPYIQKVIELHIMAQVMNECLESGVVLFLLRTIVFLIECSFCVLLLLIVVFRNDSFLEKLLLQ